MPQDVSHWEAIAAWFDRKMGDSGDLWHRALIDPALLRLVGSVAGLDVLDLACGNGYLSRRFARAGARVTAVDASAPIVERAKRWERQEPLGIRYHTGDAAALSMLGDGSFDLAVCNMGLMDIEDAGGALREVGRVLRPRARLVFSICHPCFDVGNASSWVVEKTGRMITVFRKVSRYREPFQDAFHWTVEGTVMHTPFYHRPLSWYFRALAGAGMAVSALEEPAPEPEMLQADNEGAWIAEIPLQCIIDARRLA